MSRLLASRLWAPRLRVSRSQVIASSGVNACSKHYSSSPTRSWSTATNRRLGTRSSALLALYAGMATRSSRSAASDRFPTVQSLADPWEAGRAAS